MLKNCFFSEPLFAISIVVMGALRGAGDSKRPFILKCLEYVGHACFTNHHLHKNDMVLSVYGLQ